ncbi:MAG TPA: RNA 2',3'-cyclic phosphodiesterase, partial [Ktedonobacteraceae bacterium]|nr:RNA 2',3'-cyclic phosphodiesterase [Ktedonobacteraceae bacterium]
MTRTFIALEMNDALQRHLAGVIRQVAQALPGIRWVDPAGIHLTLAFLGELTDEQLAEANEATEAAAQRVRAFSYRLSRLGIFGSP